MSDIVPTPYEVYVEQFGEIQAAESKDEARDAIEPVLGSLVMYDPFLDAGPEAMLHALADNSVLTYDEIEAAYYGVMRDWASTVRADQQGRSLGTA